MEFKTLAQRLENLPCGVGARGICCKNCLIGPCRILDDGVSGCGARKELIISRNIARFIASGVASYLKLALSLMKTFKLGNYFSSDFLVKRLPKTTCENLKSLDIIPEIPQNEIINSLSATSFGACSDFREIMKICLRLGVVEGMALYTITELGDKFSVKPRVREGIIGLGAIKEDKVNIIVHDTKLAIPLLREYKKYPDINLLGICCTGSDLFAKFGIPLLGNVRSEEEIIKTGAIDVLLVGDQCILPSISNLVKSYHTKLITTNNLNKIENAEHINIENNEKEEVRKIIEVARENNKNNRKNVKIKNENKKAIIGFTEDSFDYPGLYKKIENKEIKGVIAVVGCSNPRAKEDWISLYKKLSKDYLILTAGCIGFEFAEAGLLDGKRFFHFGSCVNSSRIASFFIKLASEGNKNLNEMPFLVSSPKPITEKAIAINFFFASLGLHCHFGYPTLLTNRKIQKYLEKVIYDFFGSRILLESNPDKLGESIRKIF